MHPRMLCQWQHSMRIRLHLPLCPPNHPKQALNTFYADSTRASSLPSKSSETSPQYLLCGFDSSFLSALQIIRNEPSIPSMPIRLELPLCPPNHPKRALNTFYADSTRASSLPSKSSETSPHYLLCRFDCPFLSALESTPEQPNNASDQIIRNKPSLPSMPIRLHLPLCPRIYSQNSPTMQATSKRPNHLKQALTTFYADSTAPSSLPSNLLPEQPDNASDQRKTASRALDILDEVRGDNTGKPTY
jgi:hypothetical protein